MKYIDSLGWPSKLKWVQTARLESRLLNSGNEEVATLTWKNSWGSVATGKFDGGEWTFKRSGFLNPKIRIRDSSSSEVGIVSMNLRGDGELRLADGSYQLNSHKRGIVVSGSNGSQIMMLEPPKSGRGKMIACLQIEDARGILQENLALLAILGWYITVLAAYYDDAAYVGAIVAATI